MVSHNNFKTIYLLIILPNNIIINSRFDCFILKMGASYFKCFNLYDQNILKFILRRLLFIHC